MDCLSRIFVSATIGSLLLALQPSLDFGASRICSAGEPEYLVFSGSSIGTPAAPVQNGDYQGRAAALGDIDVSHFSFASDTVAGHELVIRDGGVEAGNAEAGGRVEEIRAHVYGEILDQGNGPLVAGLLCAWQSLLNRSDYYGSLGGATPSYVGSNLMLSAAPDSEINVFSISSADFNSSRSLSFVGGLQDRFIVNILGEALTLDGLSIQLSPGMRPGQVILNFPEASFLLVTHSPDPELGYPVTFLAPHATVVLTEAKITGGLYAGRISNGCDQNPGDGQVNYAPVTLW